MLLFKVKVCWEQYGRHRVDWVVNDLLRRCWPITTVPRHFGLETSRTETYRCIPDIVCTLLYEIMVTPGLSLSLPPLLHTHAHRVRRFFHRPHSCSSRAVRQTMKIERYVN